MNPPLVAQTGPNVDTALPADVLEKLYQSYSIKQKRPGLGVFLAASILFDLWAIFVPHGQSWVSLGKWFFFYNYRFFSKFPLYDIVVCCCFVDLCSTVVHIT